MIKVLFTRMGDLIPEALGLALLETLPPEARLDVNRYLRQQDRQSRLLGKLLLRKCLISYGYGNDCLEHLATGPFGKPVIHGGVDFNISHSGEFVVCAVTDQGKVGIDIEKIKPILVQDFYLCVTPNEREMLASSDDKERAFFSFWTKKECTLKGDGRGLLFPMQEVRIEGDEAILEGTRWFLREIDIDSSCVCHLASSFRSDDVALKEAPIQTLS